MSTILHITHQDDWQNALAQGIYETSSIATEGFIHCSFTGQVITVANRFYTGQKDLLILVIDSDKLIAELRVEGPIDPITHQVEAGTNDLFPHLYGALNLDAVTKVLAFPPNNDGRFTLPEL